MLILKAQQSPWTLGRSTENIWSWQLEKMYYPLCMKTFGNGRKALQKNVKLSQLYNCTFEKMTNKVSTRCQQGVNKVSTRCQICNHLPRKKCKSSYLSFVCRQKIIFVFVFAFVICFWREGRGWSWLVTIIPTSLSPNTCVKMVC